MSESESLKMIAKDLLATDDSTVHDISNNFSEYIKRLKELEKQFGQLALSKEGKRVFSKEVKLVLEPLESAIRTAEYQIKDSIRFYRD